MKTIQLSDRTFDQLQTCAESEHLTIDEVVSCLVTEQPQTEERRFEELERLQLETVRRIRERGPAFQAGDRLPRSEVHERNGLR